MTAQQFSYKEIDQEGLETLTVIEKADKFNKWMYDTIKPFCKGNILEIGSGTGNISQFFLKANQSITLSDIRKNYCDILSNKFSGFRSLKDVITLNLTDPDFDKNFSQYFNTFDSIFALNVVEHIEEDALALKNCHKLLKPNGHLIILVPAFQFLYNRFDKELEHFRRYSKKSLNKIFLDTGFQIQSSKYFNLAGILGWYISGSVLKKKTIPGGQMALYNALVPLFKIVDKVISNAAGLSVVTVGRKK